MLWLHTDKLALTAAERYSQMRVISATNETKLKSSLMANYDRDTQPDSALLHIQLALQTFPEINTKRQTVDM